VNPIYTPSIGNTLWIPTTKGPHLAVVIATTKAHNHSLLITLSTLKRTTKEEPLLILTKQDHPSLSHNTFVKYRKPVLASVTDFHKWASDKSLGGMRSGFSMNYIHTFQRGLMSSPNVAQKFKDFASVNMVCAGCSSGDLFMNCCGQVLKDA